MVRQLDRLLQFEKQVVVPKQVMKQEQKLMQKQVQKLAQKFRPPTPVTRYKYDFKEPMPPKIVPEVIIPRMHYAELRKPMKIKAYEAFIIEKGKPRLIVRGVSKQAAMDIGAREISRTLRATFGVRESREPLREVTTRREFQRLSKLLRAPALKSPYRKFGEEVFVQKKERVGEFGGRLAFKGEREEIQMARMKKAMRMIP